MRTYDPNDVNVIVDGRYLTGFASGTFVSVEKDEDKYSAYVGAQGEVVRAETANNMGKIVVTLEHTSPSNTFLSGLAKRREPFAAHMIDRGSREMTVGGSQCWILKDADEDRGSEPSEVEWTIVVADYEKS